MSAARLLALGDSYTIGEGVAESTRWPSQVAAALRDAGIAIATPRVIATTGWTTDELADALDAAEPLPRDWSLVTLLIGVNDQYRERPFAQFAAQFDALLLRAIGYVGGDATRVLCVSIPDWGVTSFGIASGRDRARIAQALDAYNAHVQQRAEACGAAFIDITGISRTAGNAPNMLVDDGLHLSAAQYALWCQAIAPLAQARLTSSSLPSIGQPS